MRIKIDQVEQLPVGKQLDRMQVHSCIECEGKFLGRAGALYCSKRCASRYRQRRLYAKRLGAGPQE